MNELDDLPLMLPQAPRHAGKPENNQPIETVPLKADPAHFESRPGEHDEGEGRLPQVPTQLEALTKDDVAKEISALDQELTQAQELLTSEPSVFGLSSLFGHPLVGVVMLASAGILGLFLFNQICTAIIAIQSLNGPMWYVGWGVFSLLCTVVIYAMTRFLWLMLTLKKNQQLRLQGLEELENRTRLRWLINAKRHEAFEHLSTYLNDYPTRSTKERDRLKRVGISGEALYQLATQRDLLLQRDRWADADAWLTGFREQFQQRLDVLAQARIRYWSKRAAFATAVSPNSLADTGLTMYFSFAMISDLCTIYNLRAGNLGTMVILSRVFLNSYAAGQINEFEGVASDQIQQLVEPHIPTSEVLLGKIFSKVGAKASAGAINYLLISRLGKYTLRLLRPVA